MVLGNGKIKTITELNSLIDHIEKIKGCLVWMEYREEDLAVYAIVNNESKVYLYKVYSSTKNAFIIRADEHFEHTNRGGKIYTLFMKQFIDNKINKASRPVKWKKVK